MPVDFHAIREDNPGPKWAARFQRYWPSYAEWWTREGLSSRPTYQASRQAIGKHMPEMQGLYDQLCELAGGGDLQARFLSFFCPPRYLAGCSQAIWTGDEPLLVRNYDYDPHAFDAVVLNTKWQGRRVIGTSDGLFGLVDGMNDAGLAVSLTFGGRQAVGEGFGVPLILRYIMQVCETVKEAESVLKRVPCHMSYNVTVLDAKRRYFTAYLAPDRDPVITHAAVATNHQEKVEWSSHARFTATVERERFLLQKLTLHPGPAEKFIGAFLKPPIYSLAFGLGFGTLYTAAYRPRLGELSLHWPDRTWTKSFESFEDGAISITYPEVQRQGRVY